jgi:MYXO-CTERM domain-containing protein
MADTPYTSNLRVMIRWAGELTDPADIVVAPSMENVKGGFAYVVPVPSSLTPDDMFLIETEAFDVIDKWSSPREIQRPCPYEKWESVDACPEYSDGGGSSGDSSSRSEVSVTTRQLGAYELHFLASEGADALLDWLDSEGLALPEAAADHVDDYLDRDYSFVAVRVADDAEFVDGTELPALGFHLSEGLTTLPMLMSAAVARTEQNVTIFTIGVEVGSIGLSNVTQIEPEYQHCMVRDGDIGSAYDEDLSNQHAMAGTAVWQQDFFYGESEYPDQGPLTSVRLSAEDWAAIESTFGSELPQNVGRIQLRYAPGELTVDPAFYVMAPPSHPFLERYFIEYEENRTSDYEVCGVGLTEEGTCPVPIMDYSNCGDDFESPLYGADPAASSNPDTPTASGGSKGGCSTAGTASSASWWTLVVAGLLLGVGRRRD